MKKLVFMFLTNIFLFKAFSTWRKLVSHIYITITAFSHEQIELPHFHFSTERTLPNIRKISFARVGHKQLYDLGRVMRKHAFCICKNKSAEQLKRLCFHHIDSIIPLLPKSEIFKPLAIFCGCTAQFVSDLVLNPKDVFSLRLIFGNFVLSSSSSHLSSSSLLFTSSSSF